MDHFLGGVVDAGAYKGVVLSFLFCSQKFTAPCLRQLVQLSAASLDLAVLILPPGNICKTKPGLFQDFS